MTNPIERARDEIDAAVEEFSRDRAALYRDGGPLYSEAVHRERIAALTATLHRARDRAQEVAARELAELGRLEEARHDDPVAALSPAELASANARREFVKEDAMNLPLGELLQRVRGVVAAGGERPDKATSFLYARYGRLRVASLQEAAAEGGRPVAAAERAQVEELGKLIGRLESVLAPVGTVSPVEARQRRMVARDLQRHVAARVGAVDGTHETLRHELVQTGRYAF